MSRYIVLCTALLVAGFANAGDAEKFFGDRVKDFGTVPYGPTMVHNFKVTNSSNQTVYIKGVGVSCGCVSASVAVGPYHFGM